MSAPEAELLGQDHLLRAVLGGARRGRVAHAYVLAGPAGAGKGTVARTIAAALLCGQPAPDGRGCGICPACVAVARGGHPGVSWMDGNGSLGIEDARRMGRQAALAPHSGPCSVFVLEGAERLTGPAAVALLKTLEDPPGPMVALLLAEHPDQIEATLRSRCLVARLRPVAEATLAEWLERRCPQVPPERRAAAARAARGLPGVALRLVTEEAGAVPGGDEAIVAALTGREPLRAAVAVAGADVAPTRALELLRDACVRAQGLEAEVAACSGAEPGLLARLEPAVSPAALAASGAWCLRAAEAGDHNVNAALIWVVLVNRLRGALPPC